MFGVVSRHFVAGCDPLRKQESGCIQGMSLCHRNHSFFFRYVLGPKLLFGVVSRHFVAARNPLQKRVCASIQGTGLFHRNHFLFFCNEHALSTTLGPKLMFSKVSHHFVDAPDPLQKLVSACIWLNVVFFKNSRTLDILLERFQCTPLGPKLTFWVFANHFGALKCPFGFAPHTLRLKLVFQVVSRISLPYLTHCENQYRVH